MRRRRSDASSCLCTCARESPRSRFRHREVELRREHVRVARPRREHLAEELLRGAVRVDVRRVDEVDAGVERRVDARDRLLARNAAAEGQPRAEADLRDVQVARPELPVPHRAIVAKSAQMPSEPGRTVAGVAKAAAVQFACTECGTVSGRWLGRCPGCGAFGTLVEESVPARGAKPAQARPLLRLVDVLAEESTRISTGVDELDRVLGGGLVPASLVLVGGEPGVGKSTLLLTALGAVSRDAARAARHRRGVGGAGEAPRGAPRRLRERRDPRRDRARRRLRDARARAAGRVRDRLGADALRGRAGLDARLGRAGPRGGEPAPARLEGVRRGDVPRRPRDEGRHRRRPARARAPRRLRAPVRGRPLPRPPHPARGQEPLRLDQRARRLRDDRRRPRRRAGRIGALRRERGGRGRLGRHLHDRGHAAAAARDPGARRARATSRCRAASPPASTRSGSR